MVNPCQVSQRRMAPLAAQPFGPGLFLRDAAFLVAYLDDQTALLVPCLAQKQAPARPRTNGNRPSGQKPQAFHVDVTSAHTRVSADEVESAPLYYRQLILRGLPCSAVI
ncbi:MAG TPA: hypothetical protein DIC26_14590 [Pseudomonas sp.]|nr:hypothetical protein [Pseudomonas sp.]